jgi:hypothetical protein
MPIRSEYRWLYPVDWKQLSAVIRFERAKGQCQGCGRPHGHIICHLGDGRWWDPQRQSWRDGEGRRIRRRLVIQDLQEQIQTTRVVLATAHRDQRPTARRPANIVKVAIANKLARVAWAVLQDSRGYRAPVATAA